MSSPTYQYSPEELRLRGELDDAERELAVFRAEFERIDAEWQALSDKRVEYQYKGDKIKELKKELKQAVTDIEHKKKVYAYMEQEWKQMPKDVNRNQYTKRIAEIIHNLKI